MKKTLLVLISLTTLQILSDDTQKTLTKTRQEKIDFIAEKQFKDIRQVADITMKSFLQQSKLTLPQNLIDKVNNFSIELGKTIIDLIFKDLDDEDVNVLYNFCLTSTCDKIQKAVKNLAPELGKLQADMVAKINSDPEFIEFARSQKEALLAKQIEEKK